MENSEIIFARARYLIQYPAEKRVIEDGYILCGNGKILETGKFSNEVLSRIKHNYGDITVLSQKKKGEFPKINGVILPGFIKSHGHDHEPPIIGISKDMPLTKWLDSAVNVFTEFLIEHRDRLEEILGESPHYLTYLKARLDDIQFGITTSLVHHCNFSKYHVDELIRANQFAGTKMIIAVGSQDRNYYHKILDTPEEAVQRLNYLYSRYGMLEKTRIIPGPDQFFSNSQEMLLKLKEWAISHDSLFHIHSSEEPKTTAWFRRKYGMTPVEYGEKIGILDEKTLLAHQVNTTEKDIEILRKYNCGVVHNPLANTILGSGMPPLIKMMNSGIRVSISTDGSGSADNQNIINAARLASQYQKAYHRDATLLPAHTVLGMITSVPAQMLGVNAGVLEAGYDADFIIIDLSRPNLIPSRPDNIIQNIIWASAGNEISYVVANGRLILDNYRYKLPDVEGILGSVEKISELFVEYASDKVIRETGANRI